SPSSAAASAMASGEEAPSRKLYAVWACSSAYGTASRGRGPGGGVYPPRVRDQAGASLPSPGCGCSGRRGSGRPDRIRSSSDQLSGPWYQFTGHRPPGRRGRWERGQSRVNDSTTQPDASPGSGLRQLFRRGGSSRVPGSTRQARPSVWRTTAASGASGSMVSTRASIPASTPGSRTPAARAEGADEVAHPGPGARAAYGALGHLPGRGPGPASPPVLGGDPALQFGLDAPERVALLRGPVGVARPRREHHGGEPVAAGV